MPSDSGLFQGLPEVLLFPFCLKELYAGWRVSILEEIATHQQLSSPNVTTETKIPVILGGRGGGKKKGSKERERERSKQAFWGQ